MPRLLEIDATWTVNETLGHYPETVAVFNRYGIDACCGGGATLEEAALAEGASVEVLLEALRLEIGQR